MRATDQPPVEMFGLEHCDTCKKARKWLATAGIACRFSDYRQQPIAGEQLKAWGAELGWEVLVNRSGTTWRNLLPQRQHPGTAAEYVLLVRENPSLLRRPILMVDGKVTLGFSHGLYEKLFA
jgi:Spx/MgsR family transcriptional regulator